MKDEQQLVIKAEGPGGNVGKPGDAVEAVIEENEGKIGMVIMIDAGLKLEGETVGEVVRRHWCSNRWTRSRSIQD